MTACGAYSMYYGIVLLFPIAASRSMCKYYTVIRYYTTILYISRRRGCAEASEGSKFPARPTSCLSIDHRNLAQQAGYGPCNSIWGDQSSCWRCRNCHGNSKPKIRVRPEPRGEANNCWRLSSRKAVHLTSVISMCPDYM
ncbi:hypothetical protein J3E69DRAFT_348808 [Trichoderma sp. SZMC 28015]